MKAGGAGSPTGPATEMETSPSVATLIRTHDLEDYNYGCRSFERKPAKEDRYTSIHIAEFECEARETKLGRKSQDIPNVGKTLKNLDENWGLSMSGRK